MELATLEALRLKLRDTEFCKMCPAGSTPVLQTRWHVLGECPAGIVTYAMRG